MINISFRAVTDDDIELISAWFKKEHISKWYGDTREWLKRIRERNSGYQWAKHLIVMDGDKPVGYCQYSDCFLSDDSEAWDAVSSGDTFTIEYMIGDETYLGKGYGKAIVELLTEHLRDKVGARRVIAMPDSENHASNTILRTNGYIFDDYAEYYVIEF